MFGNEPFTEKATLNLTKAFAKFIFVMQGLLDLSNMSPIAQTWLQKQCTTLRDVRGWLALCVRLFTLNFVSRKPLATTLGGLGGGCRLRYGAVKFSTERLSIALMIHEQKVGARAKFVGTSQPGPHLSQRRFQAMCPAIFLWEGLRENQNSHAFATKCFIFLVGSEPLQEHNHEDSL